MTENHPEELVPVDDTIIGRAFKWSLGVIAALAVTAGAVFWIVTRPEPETPPQDLPDTVPIVPGRTIEPPAARFTDITTSSGVTFAHANGARGEKLLPETMGGGCAVFDYDVDGDQDLLFVNGTRWPDDPDTGPAPVQSLWANDGTGRFTDVTETAGLALSFYGMGAAVGDYDNDGDPDLYLTAVGPNRMLRNDGGVFHDVTSAAGVAGKDDGWSTSAGFFDADNDGDLDLFVCDYVRWSKAIDYEVDYQLIGLGRAYGPPTNFQGAFPSLYRNDGDGTFTDVSASAGIQVTNEATGVPVAKALALVFVDIGGDGLTDVIVANDTVANFVFRNRGDCTFEEIGAASGIAYSGMGTATGAMGIDSGHFRNDRALACAIGNFANEMTSLYVTQTDDWSFADEAIGEGVGAASRKALSFGLFFFDYDLDGRLDLFQANGHLEEEINAVQPSQHYRQPSQLFWNAGPEARSCFVEVPAESMGDLALPVVGRGAAYGDLDSDGDLDVVLTQIADRPVILRNDQQTGRHWLRVRLEGVEANRDGIGAWVELHVPGMPPQRRQVMPTRSYLSQVELPVTFGLGDADRVESLEITWPGGSRQRVEVDRVDTTLDVTQSSP